MTVEGVLPTNAPSSSMSARGGTESIPKEACGTIEDGAVGAVAGDSIF